MKKLIILLIICILTVGGCTGNDTYKINITAPAGLTEEGIYQKEFVYSDAEISPKGNRLVIYSGQDLGDSLVVLMPVEVKEERVYEPIYITPGMPIEIEVEKGAWYKVGVAMQNSSDEDVRVTLTIENINVRIE